MNFNIGDIQRHTEYTRIYVYIYLRITKNTKTILYEWAYTYNPTYLTEKRRSCTNKYFCACLKKTEKRDKEKLLVGLFFVLFSTFHFCKYFFDFNG